MGAGPGFATVTPTGVVLGNPVGTGTFLRQNGIVAASIMNNHQYDGGGGTAERLRAGGVEAFGHVRLDVRGQFVTLFAHDLGEPDVPGAVMRELAGADGLRVESFHVTGPPSYLPTKALIAAVDAAVLGGADIVVAHGTHVVGPVERRGQTVIAWGLGNLLFDCECTQVTEAMILKVSLGAGHPAEVLPIQAGLGGAGALRSPDPLGVLGVVNALGGTGMVVEGGRGKF